MTGLLVDCSEHARGRGRKPDNRQSRETAKSNVSRSHRRFLHSSEIHFWRDVGLFGFVFFGTSKSVSETLGGRERLRLDKSSSSNRKNSDSDHSLFSPTAMWVSQCASGCTVRVGVCERERETTAYTRSFSSFSRGNSSKQHNKWFDNFLAPSGSLSALVSSRSSLSVLGVRENATRSPRLGLDISPGTGFYIPHGERSKRKNTSSSVFLGR